MSTMRTRLVARVSEEPATQRESDWPAKNVRMEKSALEPLRSNV